MLHEADVIDQFARAMEERGIRVSAADIVPDGKFHRIHVEGDRKGSRNGWYILHNDARPAGAFGCNRRFGHREKFTWTGKSSKPLSPDERRKLREEMRRKQAEREAALRAKRAAAAALANKIWDTARECVDHPYLARKGVRSHGLRVGVWEKVNEETGEIWTVSKQALLVPIRDTKKRIHSLQAIFPAKILDHKTRDKDYLKDGDKEGLFYSIGKPIEHDGRLVIIICEGYATGATLHECTGHAVIVAFDAPNLLPVARVIRERFQDAILIFAADNDQWTLKPIENPGLTRAREAAKDVGGLVAVPQFPADHPDKPSDFNDLQLLEGADAVRAVIDATLSPQPVDEAPQPVPAEDTPPWEGEVDLPAPRDEAPATESSGEDDDGGDGGDDDDEGPANNRYFAVLGYDHDRYFIFQFGKRQIATITKGDMSEKGLIELAPLNWWEAQYPGARGGIDTSMAANFLIRTAEKHGIYDISRIRGRGAWVDEGRIVYHHGGYLTIDGKKSDITEIRSKYVYELAQSLPDPADDALSSDEGEMLLDIARQFRWTTPGSAALLAGWVALAPVCGALRWRPHIWITGGAGSGKTTVLNMYAHHLLGGLDVYAQGNSSEAGIRQTLRADALPVLFDESESNEEADARRIQSVLSLIRQASTESNARTLKGTAGGDALHYHIRSMFCLSSIQVALKQKADIDRLTVLAMRSAAGEPNAGENWRRLRDQLYSMQRDESLPARLLRRSIDLLPITLQNILVFTDAAADRFGSQRDGDQYGTLLAGAWSLISTRVATREEALEMIDSYDWSEHRDLADSDESQKALAALMEAHIRITGGIDVTVYELVCAAAGHPTDVVDLDRSKADAFLMRHGMRVQDGWLLISNNSSELKRLMAGTTYEADLRGVLLRIPGAEKSGRDNARFAGVCSKYIKLPLSPIIGDEPGKPPF